MRIIHAETFAHAYAKIVQELLCRPDAVRSPRGMKCAELTPCIMQVPVGRYEDCLFEGPTRSTDRRYLARELFLYYSGARKEDEFVWASKFWGGLGGPDGNVDSAYGYQLLRKRSDHGLTEWEWALRCLIEDVDTRQSVMVLHAPRHHRPGTKDLPCTLNVTFSRERDALDMTVVMRSNDVWYGLTYDAPFFVTLLRNASMLLGCSPRMYTHVALNMHAYERDWPALRLMLDDGIAPPEDPLPRQELPWVDRGGALTPAFTLRKDPLAAHLAGVGGWP